MLQVLLINDDRTMQPTPEWLLQDANVALEVLEVQTWSAAQFPLEHQTVDCVLWVLDPEVELWQLIQQLPAWAKSVPIVVVGASSAAKTAADWQKAGICTVLDRTSLTPELLSQMLQSAVRTCQAEHQAAVAMQRLKQNDHLLEQQYQIIEEQQQQIQRLRAQLLEVSRLKNQFLSIMSHELRTPMNAILGFSQLLLRQKQGADTKQTMLLQRILANAKQLMTIIDQILDFAKIEAGEWQIRPQSCNLLHLVRAVADELQTNVTQKQLELKVDCELSNPHIVADPTCLQRILFSLISNAVKFTATGSVTVMIQETPANRVMVSIKDTGIGMKPTDLELIFEPFRQVDQSITRQHRGIGLGLAVAAALVHQMKGTLTAKSILGQGSEFRVELPRQIRCASIRTMAPVGSGHSC